MLVELRSDGCQTLVPPSVHPSGEPIAWAEDGEPATVAAEALQTDAARLASAALLARYWPGPGSRHDAALALAGGLLRAGWEEDETAAFISAIAHAAGDEEPADRANAAVSSARSQAAGKPTSGWPTLARLIAPRVVDRVREWLRITSHTTIRETNNSYEEFTTGIEARSDPEGLPVPFRFRPFPWPSSRPWCGAT